MIEVQVRGQAANTMGTASVQMHRTPRRRGRDARLRGLTSARGAM